MADVVLVLRDGARSRIPEAVGSDLHAMVVLGVRTYLRLPGSPVGVIGPRTEPQDRIAVPVADAKFCLASLGEGP